MTIVVWLCLAVPLIYTSQVLMGPLSRRRFVTTATLLSLITCAWFILLVRIAHSM